MSLYQPKTELIICGDINIDYLPHSFKKRQLSQLLGSYNISHLVNFPTRFQQCNILPIHNGLSDHNAQRLLLKKMSIKKKKNF